MTLRYYTVKNQNTQHSEVPNDHSRPHTNQSIHKNKPTNGFEVWDDEQRPQQGWHCSS